MHNLYREEGTGNEYVCRRNRISWVTQGVDRAGHTCERGRFLTDRDRQAAATFGRRPTASEHRKRSSTGHRPTTKWLVVAGRSSASQRRRDER